MNKLKEFNENGFYIARSITPLSMHKEIFLTFYDVIISMINRHKIKIESEIKKIMKSGFTDCLFKPLTL